MGSDSEEKEEVNKVTETSLREPDNDQDDFVFKIFFKEKEIEKTKQLQKRDLFEDLIETRKDAIIESSYLIGGTKFNIQDFAPKPKAAVTPLNKKKK